MSGDLPGNLAKMSLSAPNMKNKYTLNLKNNNTKCGTCSFDVAFTKNALLCPRCDFHWFCSPQCRDQCREDYCVPEMNSFRCDSLDSFYHYILSSYKDLDTLNMVKEYIKSKAGVSRDKIKKLAEAGDWKAALVLGLTYELRFICDWSKCKFAIRPPYEKSQLFTNRKAIKYFNMAADQNSVEAYAGLARVLNAQLGTDREVKEYALRSFRKIECSKFILLTKSFPELRIVSNDIREKYRKGEELELPNHAVSGLILFRLLELNPRSPVLKEYLLLPNIAEVFSLLKSCVPQPRIVFYSNLFMFHAKRSVDNLIFSQKADVFRGKETTLVKVDPGVMMDAKAIYDKGFFQRLNKDRPLYLCEHDLNTVGNTCTQCAQLARERILSVYENSFLLSKDEIVIGEIYSAIFTLESGLKKLDNFRNYGKYEIIVAIRVMALQPMDLHPVQLAKDPDMYWPIVHYYGSVYSALKEILDGKMVDSIYENIPESTPLPERINIVDEKQFVIKCGHNTCVHLDWEFKFKQCTRCKLRRYCSPSCQKLDWKLHKKECFLRPGMVNTDAEVD